MDILLKRIAMRAEYTIGKMYLNFQYFCDTLEDAVRDFGKNGEGKIYGKTAIPAGRYRVILSYSPKFKRILPLLLDVPYYCGIRIHSGNTAKDTEGCLLVGENKVKGKVINSRKWEQELVRRLQALPESEEVWITIE